MRTSFKGLNKFSEISKSGLPELKLGLTGNKDHMNRFNYDVQYILRTEKGSLMYSRYHEEINLPLLTLNRMYSLL